MTLIRSYNFATGHTETLACVPTCQASQAAAMFDDHSTDHVVYAVHQDITEEDRAMRSWNREDD